MSESKAEYYAKHLETLVEPEVQPSGLPTLLARMVVEFQVGLGSQPPETHEILVRTFTADLLAAAQPLLAAYLEQLTSPLKFVLKPTPADYTRAEEAMEMARAGKGASAARKHLGLE